MSNPPAKGGHVQHGHRPALVIADTTKAIATVIPITASLAATRFPYTIAVTPTEGNGLDKPSVLLLYQLGAVDKCLLPRKIGTLEAATLQHVNGQLKAMLQIT